MALTDEITLMTEEQIVRSLMDVMGHLHDRAAAALADDPDSEGARIASMQYLVTVEAIALLGTQLIALDDIAKEPETHGGDENSN